MNEQEHKSDAEVESFPVAQEAAEERERKLPVKRQLAVALAVLGLALGTTYISNLLTHGNGPDTQQASVSESTPDTDRTDDPFADLELQARAVFVWDVQEQRTLYSKDPDEALPLASITKLMTALVAYELLGEDTDVRIGSDAIAQAGDSGLAESERFNSRDLTDFTLIASSNDGAYALADEADLVLKRAGDTNSFIDVMNMRAGEIGLTRTTFRNPTGLDFSETKGGADGSARDVAFLMEYFLTNYSDVLEATRNDEQYVPNANGQTHEASNTNAVVSRIPGILASKTGYTELAGGNLVVAFDAGLNHPVIIAVLGSTSLGRFTDMLTLVGAAQKAVVVD